MKRVLAALIFFTRLPLWRVVNVPSEYFKRVVELWPVAGWLTGGVTAITLYLASYIFPPFLAVILAVGARLLLTGALHEDGLADFCDGFGGGTTRDRILAIMKDSHIGTYGVLGLIVYFMMLVGALASLPVPTVCFVILAGDCWAKMCAAQIINFLPYARTAETAKNGVVYARFGIGAWFVALVVAIIPAIWLPICLWWAYLTPVVIITLLIVMMRRRISGYTGDCCGASFLICELSFYLTVVALWN